jgi:hypothetical protein
MENLSSRKQFVIKEEFTTFKKSVIGRINDNSGVTSAEAVLVDNTI